MLELHQKALAARIIAQPHTCSTAALCSLFVRGAAPCRVCPKFVTRQQRATANSHHPATVHSSGTTATTLHQNNTWPRPYSHMIPTMPQYRSTHLPHTHTTKSITICVAIQYPTCSCGIEEVPDQQLQRVVLLSADASWQHIGMPPRTHQPHKAPLLQHPLPCHPQQRKASWASLQGLLPEQAALPINPL